MSASVLIVEDDAVIAWGIENRLTHLKYSVCGIAMSGDEAIEKAIAMRPDIILMDINLGNGIDGIEAAGLIRDLTEIPVVYLTAHSDDATIQRAKLTEPFGFVLKPYEDSDLRTAIEIGLHRSSMEQQLRKSQQWLAATLSSIGDGVIAVDKRGCVSFMNRLAEELTGWSLAEALGREVTNIFRIVEESTRRTVRNPVIESLTTGTKVGLAKNTILVNRDGSERFIDDSAAPITGNGAELDGAVLVFRDVTQERLEEERRKQTQSLEAIGRMASGIAHDFNNIMTGIINYTEVLRNGDISAEQRLSAVEQIREGGNRAAQLTQQIVAFSRKQMLVPVRIDLNHLITEITSGLQNLLGEKVDLVFTPSPEACPLKVDPTQLEQAIINVVTNARDAMPNGGCVSLSTSIVKLDEGTTGLHPDVQAGAYVRLSVTDTGTGISQDVLPRIFEPFFTTKDAGSGIGLGLSVVHGIIKQSRGHIEVTSELEQGTTFNIFLPLNESPVPQPHSQDASASLASGETILLVDDEDLVRDSTKFLLETMGYTILDASCGSEALNIAANYQGPIHLLLTDLMMPNLNGQELAQAVTAIRPELPVLYMSGHTADEVIRKSIESEPHHFLQKPFNLSSLKSSIANTIKRAPGSKSAQ